MRWIVIPSAWNRAPAAQCFLACAASADGLSGCMHADARTQVLVLCGAVGLILTHTLKQDLAKLDKDSPNGGDGSGGAADELLMLDGAGDGGPGGAGGGWKDVRNDVFRPPAHLHVYARISPASERASTACRFLPDWLRYVYACIRMHIRSCVRAWRPPFSRVLHARARARACACTCSCACACVTVCPHLSMRISGFCASVCACLSVCVCLRAPVCLSAGSLCVAQLRGGGGHGRAAVPHDSRHAADCARAGRHLRRTRAARPHRARPLRPHFSRQVLQCTDAHACSHATQRKKQADLPCLVVRLSGGGALHAGRCCFLFLSSVRLCLAARVLLSCCSPFLLFAHPLRKRNVLG
jgi:hypothetical protein